MLKLNFACTHLAARSLWKRLTHLQAEQELGEALQVERFRRRDDEVGDGDGQRVVHVGVAGRDAAALLQLIRPFKMNILYIRLESKQTSFDWLANVVFRFLVSCIFDPDRA